MSFVSIHHKAIFNARVKFFSFYLHKLN